MLVVLSVGCVLINHRGLCHHASVRHWITPMSTVLVLLLTTWQDVVAPFAATGVHTVAPLSAKDTLELQDTYR